MIIHCRTCSSSSNTTCDSCKAGYSLNANSTACNPVCFDPSCTTCIHPGICRTCSGLNLPD